MYMDMCTISHCVCPCCVSVCVGGKFVRLLQEGVGRRGLDQAQRVPLDTHCTVLYCTALLLHRTAGCCCCDCGGRVTALKAGVHCDWLAAVSVLAVDVC